MSIPFVKVYTKVLDSSIWVNEDAPTRLLWLTMLLMSDSDGYVRAPLVGIAARARITLAEAERGMERLTMPDPYSSSSDHAGRRVEANGPGCWLVLNRRKYWDLRTKEQANAAARQAKYHAKRKASPSDLTATDGSHARSRAEGELDGDQDLPSGEEGFALRPPLPKAKAVKGTKAAKPVNGCTDEQWETVLDGYSRCREVAGLGKAWGTYKDTADNRKRAARVCADRTREEVLAIFEHVGRSIRAGTFGATKWAGLDFMQRKMDEYANEIAAGPAAQASRSGVGPVSYLPSVEEPTDEEIEEAVAKAFRQERPTPARGPA